MPIYRKIAGVGGGTGLDITPGETETPPSVTISRVSVIDAGPDAQGVPQKRITVTYVPPVTTGSLIGLWCYLDAPDTAGALIPAAGLVAADGTTGEAGTFEPFEVGFFPHNAASPQFSFYFRAPSKDEYWRVYIVPGSILRHDSPVQAGQAGASESQQFRVSAPATPITGREYAPLVRNVSLTVAADLGWDSNPLQIQGESGDQSWVVSVDWEWPTDDQNWQSVGGVNVVLDDGTIQIYIGNVDKGREPRWQSQPLVLKPGTTNYTVYLISYNTLKQNNSLYEGITPSISFDVTRQTGNAGVEYTSLVTSDGVHDFVTVEPLVGADGTQLLRITGYFTAPNDPTFGGVEINAKRPDDVVYTLKSGRTAPIQVDISQPATVESWRFYLRSVDVNGRRNSIKDDGDGSVEAGETPWIDISVGNATGQLNLAKAKTSSFDTDLAISGGKLTLGNVSATKLVTGILQVGGGGSKVSIMKIFDGLGSLIGWWGDDTGTSGYVGGWAKQFRIGGASPASAQIVADSSGNLTVSTSLLVGTFPTSSLTGLIVDGQIDTGVALYKLAAGTLPGTVIYGGTIAASQILGGTISAAISINSGGTLSVSDFASFGGYGIFSSGDISTSASFSATGSITTSSAFYVATVQVINSSKKFVGPGGVDTAGPIDTWGPYKVLGTQVVTSRQTGPGSPSFSSLSDVQTWCGNLLTALQTHGLVS